MTRALDEIVGQQGAAETLRRLLASRRIPHGLLFCGPEGVGKATVARLFAAALLCESQDAEACGDCRSCRALATSNHPDFTWVGFERRPSDGEFRKEIVIDQVRALNRLAGLTPRQAPRRVFEIDPADRMNREAQNGLLKTLEEPPGSAVLILVASRPHLLLPTVRSRCFSVGFSRLNTSDLVEVLQGRGLSGDEARARAALASGSPGAAFELDLESSRTRREEILQMLELLSSGSRRELGKLPAFGAALAGKEEPHLVAGLDLLQSLLRDTARTGAAAAGESLIHLDLAPRLAALAERIGSARAAALVAAIDEARGYLRFNVNRTLLAESLLAAVAG